MPDARLTALAFGTKKPAKAIRWCRFTVPALVTSTLPPLLPSSQKASAALISICAATASRNDLSNAMSMEVWADDVAGLMDHLGLRSAHIHGTSMGGMVAQQFAAKYPERTQRLVINCSTAKLDYAGILTFRGWIDIAERFGMGSRTLAELIAMQALSRRFLDTSEGRRAVDMIQQILQDSNRVDIFKLACQAMIDMDLRPLLPKITAPTLIIGGDEDMMTPWQQGGSGAGQNYLVEHIRGAKKHVIKGSSHSTLFDGTEENCRVVLAFLKGEF